MLTNIENLETFENELPPVTKPLASYVTAVQVGDLIYTSGVLPMKDGAIIYSGPIRDSEISVKNGQEAAQLCCLNLLSVLKDKLGSLKHVEQIVKLTGYVNSPAGFKQQPQVINGASNLLAKLFGDKGKHARAAIGVSSLPLDASVEIDLIVQVKR